MLIKSNNVKFNTNKPTIEINRRQYPLNNMENLLNKRLYLKITENCNLNCIYCFQNDDEKSKVVPILKQYDSLIKRLISCKDTDIIVFGGEPLLNSNLDNLKYLFNIIPFDATYSFFTNGCFSNEVCTLLEVNKSNVRILNISIDGDENVHNLRRPLKNDNSYKKIINNINLLHSIGIPFVISINIDKQNQVFITEAIRSLKKNLDMERIPVMLNKVLHSKYTVNELDFLELCENITKKFDNVEFQINSPVYNKLQSVLTGNGYIKSRCNIENTLVLNFCNNKIYCCPENSNSNIGVIMKDSIMLNTNKHSSYTDLSCKMNTQCLNCEFFYYCKYGCISDAIPNEHICKSETKNELQFLIDNFFYFFTVNNSNN